MISVITPVYNGADYIRSTVESVLNSGVSFGIEYIVVNDGSTDQTLEILKTFGNQIVLLEKENGGESSAVNLGLSSASGEIVLIVSADDPLPGPEIFHGAEEFFRLNPGVVAWYPNWTIIDSQGNELRKVEVDEYSDLALIGRFKCLPGPGALFRKSAAHSIGGRNLRWRFVGDYDFWLRLSRTGALAKRNQYLAQWRFHPDSTSIAQRGTDMAKERIDVIEKFIESNKELDLSLIKEARAHAYYYAARLSFFDPRVDGRKYLAKALISNNFRIKDSNLLVYVFIFCLPFSRLCVYFIKPLLRKFGRALT